MTTDQLIHRCAEYLREAGVDTPEHDVKLIMADVLGCSPSDVESAAIMRTDVRALCAKYGRDDDAELAGVMHANRCSTSWAMRRSAISTSRWGPGCSFRGRRPN